MWQTCDRASQHRKLQWRNSYEQKEWNGRGATGAHAVYTACPSRNRVSNGFCHRSMAKPIYHGKTHDIWVLPCNGFSHSSMAKPMDIMKRNIHGFCHGSFKRKLSLCRLCRYLPSFVRLFLGQMANTIRCQITLVALFWLFSTVHLQMCPQMASMKSCMHNRIGCICLIFLHCAYWNVA